MGILKSLSALILMHRSVEVHGACPARMHYVLMMMHTLHKESVFLSFYML